MIVRATDASLHNRIANHPDVKPSFGYNEGPTDFTPLLAHPEGYVLLSDGDGAAAVFEWSAPNVWQAHIFLMPESRGAYGIKAVKAMAEFMFLSGAKMLWGMAPAERKQVGRFGRLIGARPAGEGEDAMGTRVQLFVLEG